MALPRRWGTSKKLEARRVSVIQPWRELSGQLSLPPFTQYWTLCGKLTDSGGITLDPFCEPLQLVEEGLIRITQFNGVERDRLIHAQNAAAVTSPDHKHRPHLFWGDLVQVLDNASASECFRPAIVNIDTPASPKHGFEVLAGVLAVLNRTGHKTMVVWNVVAEDRLKGQQRKFQPQLERFADYEFLDRQLRAGWWAALGQYEYSGTSTYSVSKMVSFVFWNGSRRKAA
jgi:hypothetical protein